ncbi:FAD-binding domain-containing protein [Phellopilus nigrolimitatus]|nr:FAD-binding domain-containing protein [Phellopilus nigrolimitatus]
MKLSLVQVVLFYASTSAAVLHTSDWARLNRTVHGRLFTGTPFARPCFRDANDTSGSFQASDCAVVEENYMNRTFRLDIFGSYMNTEWETCQSTSEQCLLDSSAPNNTLAFNPPQMCSQGSIPSYYNTDDIIAGLEFATSTGVTLVIKNTGHDYKGRSSAPNSLALFTHNLKSLSYNEQFKPLGSTDNESLPAVTMGAGVASLALYEFADALNLTVPGGADPTVGVAGGYLMGGGHSILTNVFGLFVDRLLEIEVVTPIGQVLTANKFQNTDLFFALRGGGGGTFGVVTKVTTLALPKMQLPAFLVTAENLKTNIDLQRKWLGFMAANAVEFSNAGWGGFIFPNSGFIFTNPLLNETAAVAAMQGVQELVTKEFNGTFTHTVEPSYFSFFLKYLVTSEPVGLPFAAASRLIPVANFATNESRAELVDAHLVASNSQTLPIFFQTTPLLLDDKGETSVTPAWRNSMWHVTTSSFWNFNTTFDERVQIYSSLTSNMDVVRNITRGSGAYQNEADVYEPNFQESFWGSNYDRLLAIKKKYDPHHVMDCWQCVGWKGEVDPQFQCYIPKELV